MFELFDYCVSNPPYQINSGGNNKFSPIYHNFIQFGSNVSIKASFICPARWRHGLGVNEKRIKNDLAEKQHKITEIEINDPSDKLFPSTLIRDGVSIIYFDNLIINVNHKPTIMINDSEKEIKDINEDFYNKTAIDIFYKTKSEPVVFNNFKLMTSVANLRENTKKATKEKTSVNTLKMFAVYSHLNKAHKPEWGYVSKNICDRNIDTLLGKYKFGTMGSTSKIGSINISVCHNNNIILEKEEVLGEGGRFILFDTKEEVNNFKNYFKTNFVKFLIESTKQGREVYYSFFVPDLIDYSNNNDLFKSNKELTVNHKYYGLSLDEKLNKHFNLNKGEIKAIKENVNAERD